jgi:diacylglycerol O-acyltransferase / wax synthase
VQSYLDTLDFGLVACRELVPDLWDLVDAIVDELSILAKAADADIASG